MALVSFCTPKSIVFTFTSSAVAFRRGHAYFGNGGVHIQLYVVVMTLQPVVKSDARMVRPNKRSFEQWQTNKQTNKMLNYL